MRLIFTILVLGFAHQANALQLQELSWMVGDWGKSVLSSSGRSDDPTQYYGELKIEYIAPAACLEGRFDIFEDITNKLISTHEFKLQQSTSDEVVMEMKAAGIFGVPGQSAAGGIPGPARKHLSTTPRSETLTANSLFRDSSLPIYKVEFTNVQAPHLLQYPVRWWFHSLENYSMVIDPFFVFDDGKLGFSLFRFYK